ncbi:MAG: hypothetical protein AAFR17_14455 [Pseudomonadota bacterium]
MKILPLALRTALIFLLLAACTPVPKSPDLNAIYASVAEAGDGALRRPLITVPGTLGSRLIDSVTGTIVWGGGSRGLSADPTDPEEARLIALPLLDDTLAFEAQRDSVRPAGVLDTAEADVLGLKVTLEVYGGVRRTLSAGGFRVGPPRERDETEGFDDLTGATPLPPGPDQYRDLAENPETAFRFDYDWRRDIASLAQDFHDFILQRRQFVADQRSRMSGREVRPEEVTFDLLAHSMGGLVTRYYLMHGPAPLGEDGTLPPITWAGARHFNRVIIVATPNAGSILAMDNLVNGKELGPFQPVYEAALLATHASTWQLMPRARHNRVRYADPAAPDPVDPYDPTLWERYRWGLASEAAEPLLSWLLPGVEDAAERRDRALTHQRRMLARAERFHLAMDRWAPKPDDLEMFLVVGGGFETAAEAQVDRDTGSFGLSSVEEGDGVVLRASVLLDERQGGDYVSGLQTPLRFDTTLFLPDEHVELTKNPVFGDNLLFWLLEQPRDKGDLARTRKPALAALGAPDAPAEAAADEPDLPPSGSER